MEITKINGETIITILDYETKISDIFEVLNPGIIIDTILVSGDNSYRFIRKLDNGYEYITPGEEFLKKANNILKEHPMHVENSILTKSKIRKLLRKTTGLMIEDEKFEIIENIMGCYISSPIELKSFDDLSDLKNFDFYLDKERQEVERGNAVTTYTIQKEGEIIEEYCTIEEVVDFFEDYFNL